MNGRTPELGTLLIEILLGCAIVLALIFAGLRYGRKNIATEQGAWLRTGWTLVRQDMNRLLIRGASVHTRVYRGFAVELAHELNPSAAAPFCEVMRVRFSSRWRLFLRVELGSRLVCPFQLFERAALVRAPCFGIAPVGAVWFPRWPNRLSTADSRLDSRFELYAEDPVRASSLVAVLAGPLLAAPHFGLLEIFGSELRVYVSARAAGTVGDYGVGFAAHLDALSDLIVDVASALKNG